jgi:DNA-binding transcriptional ArsR family regulator
MDEASAVVQTAAAAHKHPMSGSGGMAAIAALIGDTARARMLDALADGRALTAGELAYLAGVTPQTASAHLARLVDGGLLTVVRQGRHRYYRLASSRIGDMLEQITLVAAMDGPSGHRPRGRLDDDFMLARSCYDHLAGRLGVAIADAMTNGGYVVLEDDAGAVTPKGTRFLMDFGIDMGGSGRRVFCRPCLDRTERRPHLAGALGAKLACRCFELGWVERSRDSRAIKVTGPGRNGLRETFGIEFSALAKPDKIAA